MTELSPQAQAVLDAYIDEDRAGRLAVAAALRAAADQVLSSVPPPCEDFDEYAQGFLAAHIKYRAELLAIAAELDPTPS
jgi:hypothetical protein